MTRLSPTAPPTAQQAANGANTAAAPRETDVDRRALVLAPRGRDAAVVLQVLTAHGVDGRQCATLGALVDEVRAGAGLAFVTEEALEGHDFLRLTDWLGAQPPWSDFPFAVLATKQAGRRSAQAHETLRRLGNVVLLERPLNAETLVSAARSALRSRTRQYETRLHLAEQQRIDRENRHLYQAERHALREAAAAREALLDVERRGRAEAEYANRMKDEFLATLSHELRTPLSAILGWVHLLRKRTADRTDLGDFTKGIDTIERNARAQSQLIDELLDMSRIIAGNVRIECAPVSASATIERVLASLQPLIDAKALAVECAFDAAADAVSADAHRLQQVVWNLLSNAIKFTSAGGHVRVALSSAGARTVIVVADDGIGIAPDFLPFVFDRFRQADGSTTRHHGGLGLGLAIVRQLVELHGGTTRVASDGLGRGSTFTVEWPGADANATVVPAEPAAEAADHAAPGALRGVRILLVDDDDDGRDVVRRLLAEGGARVDAADSAAAALDSLANRCPDVLISDIGMPEVDGHELLKRARDLGHRMPAIALTAFARAEERQRALDAGYAAHLAKPVEPGELLDAVARLTGRSGPG